jgi:uncharacterized protein
VRLDGGCGCAGSSATDDMDIWEAARNGDLRELERLVGQNPRLLNARDLIKGWTPLMWASAEGYVGMVRWLVDKGAAINGRSSLCYTALSLACGNGRTPVVRLLLERGGYACITNYSKETPLMIASNRGHLEVVHVLLGDLFGKMTINDCNTVGRTGGWPATRPGGGS